MACRAFAQDKLRAETCEAVSPSPNDSTPGQRRSGEAAPAGPGNNAHTVATINAIVDSQVRTPIPPTLTHTACVRHRPACAVAARSASVPGNPDRFYLTDMRRTGESYPRIAGSLGPRVFRASHWGRLFFAFCVECKLPKQSGCLVRAVESGTPGPPLRVLVAGGAFSGTLAPSPSSTRPCSRPPRQMPSTRVRPV